jgi:hypothetical protein
VTSARPGRDYRRTTDGHHGHNRRERWCPFLRFETDGCRWFEHRTSTAPPVRESDHPIIASESVVPNRGLDAHGAEGGRGSRRRGRGSRSPHAHRGWLLPAFTAPGNRLRLRALERPSAVSRMVTLFATLVILATLIAGISAHAAPPPCVLSDSTYRLASNFGPDTLLVRELVFESSILAAEVDSSSGTLLVSIGDRLWDERSADTRSLFRQEMRANRVVAYDLHVHRVIWDDRRKASPIAAAAGRALIQQGEHSMNLIRLPDGRELASMEGAPFLWRDGVSLRVTDGTISRWDPPTIRFAAKACQLGNACHLECSDARGARR